MFIQQDPPFHKNNMYDNNNKSQFMALIAIHDSGKDTIQCNVEL